MRQSFGSIFRRLPGLLRKYIKVDGKDEEIIHVQENEDVTFEEIPGEEPADLVASESGKIVSMIVRSGTPAVLEGMEVEKGDLLVGSRVEVLDDAGEVANAYYVHADADILIQRSEYYEASFPMHYEKKIYSGRKRTTYYLTIGRKRLDISLPHRGSYEQSDAITSEWPLKITENFYLPVVFGKITEQEYTPSDAVYTKKEATAHAKEELSLFLEKLRIKGLQIIENNVKIEINSDKCTAYGTYILEESGVKEQAPVMEIPNQEEGTDVSDSRRIYF